MVRAEIVKQFEADETKAEAVNTDPEVAIEQARSGTRVYIYVDPEGDTVRVVVTADGASGAVETRDVPSE